MSSCPECHSFLPSSCSLCMNKVFRYVKEKYEKERKDLETHSEGLFTLDDYEKPEIKD